MDICAIGDLFKEWSEPICACATLILSIAVIVINRKVDAETDSRKGCDAFAALWDIRLAREPVAWQSGAEGMDL